MPRGRHRHSQPLHRLLPPVAVAVAGLACAGGSWFVGGVGTSDTEVLVLRGLTTAAAVAAATGAVLARRWDRTAGRQVAELKARQTRTEWRAEEHQADLEGDLEESRSLRRGLEKKLRDKRVELARLRTEHAALLRRYANAETSRANVLEGRRQLEIEAAEPARQLTSAATDHRTASGAPTPLTYRQAYEALSRLKRHAERQRERHPAPDAVASAVPDGPPPGTPFSTSEPSEGFDFFGNRRDPDARGAEDGGTDPAVSGPITATTSGPAEARPETAAEPGGAPGDTAEPVRRAPAGPAGKVIDLAEPEPDAEPAGGSDAGGPIAGTDGTGTATHSGALHSA